METTDDEFGTKVEGKGMTRAGEDIVLFVTGKGGPGGIETTTL